MSTAQAATYHVAVAGSDANPGSQAQPWATLQHAADSVTAGDQVIVHSGDYAGFNLTTSGTASAWIQFTALDGATIVDPDPDRGQGINLEGPSYVIIEGFTIQGSPGELENGIRAVLGDHITIRNNQTFDNFERGIFTGFVDDVVIVGNECAGSIDEHGIYVSNSGDRPIIRNNYIHDNHANGIHMNGDASAGGDGIISGALVEGNVIINNGQGGGSGVNGDGVQDSVIQNNLIIGNHASGIALYRIDGAEGSKNNLVINNTVVNASDGRWGITISGGSTGNMVVNNIFISRHGFRGAMDVHTDSMVGFVSDYNVVEDRFTTSGGDNGTLTFAEWQTQTGQGQHSFVATEAQLFVDPTLPGGNYHLNPTSPALDVGLATGAPSDDVDGDPRPLGSGIDIGADELPACGAGGELVLANDMVSADASYQSCQIVAGPAFRVLSPAVLTLTAQVAVILRAGFSLQQGARLEITFTP